jgi:predicted acyl esterase
VLTQNLTLTGEVVADIFASTTGSDNDLVVKLIDQYPDDDPDLEYARLSAHHQRRNLPRPLSLGLRSSHRARAPAPFTSTSSRLHDVDHVFKAGHTVMVEIQSTWFPLYDRNPQTFVPNIMKAKPADYKPATITIYSGPGHDSALELPVMNAPISVCASQ